MAKKNKRNQKVIAHVKAQRGLDRKHFFEEELVGSSSSRTRNRLRERGKRGFLVKQVTNSCVALGNRKAVLLMSVADSEAGRDPWLGWLPMDEVDIVSWK